MKRTLCKHLQGWKQSKTRKPLIVLGARQVGKTTLLKKWGEAEYEHMVYVNFEENKTAHDLFEKNIEPEYIVRALEIELNIPIIPGKTLIFFDEIQECPNALNSLKYFCEKANQYHLCSAGSLLGVKLKHTKGFPVGKVDFLDLYPLDFLEFLEALPEIKLKNYLETITEIKPIFANLHEKLLELFKVYLFVGGMPEAVAAYCASRDLNKVRDIQNAIIKAYSFDFSKHAPPDIQMKINLIWNSIPAQLAKENKKYIYSVIRTGARAKEFEGALQWLSEAGLIYKVTHITTPKFPLDAYAEWDFFKIYLMDVGLLGAMAGLSAKSILHGHELFEEFKGSFVENVTAQTLAQKQFKLYYWSSEGKAELDFVLQFEGVIFPLEIKSGVTNKKKSLRVYAQKFNPPVSLRASPMNLKQDERVLNIPLYLLGEITRFLSMSIPEAF